MITNPQVFDDSHLPRELKHREGEMEALSTAFRAAADHDRAGDALISGPSGVGKTALARFVLERLEHHTKADHARIRCLGKTTTGILREAVRSYHNAPPIADNTAREELDRIAAEQITQPYILVLDEADDLPDSDALDALTDLQHVSLVVICHDQERWLARVDEDFRSRLSVHVQPRRYAVDELVDILQPRAWQGLERNVVEREQLERIADGVAGVARNGIQALHAAAELAEERGHHRITDEDIEDSFERAQRRIRESNLTSIATHHQVLYEVIREAGEISGSDLHARYERLSDQLYYGRSQTPISRRARRYKLDKLEEYDLIGATETDQGVTYSVVDPELASPLEFQVLNA